MQPNDRIYESLFQFLILYSNIYVQNGIQSLIGWMDGNYYISTRGNYFPRWLKILFLCGKQDNQSDGIE
jgi:hypothetical protein